MTQTLISTWFVADDAATATYFPQVGSRSDAPETQAVYWRCTVGFYASSLAVNPDARHAFFTNTHLPVIDGVDLAELFARWGIEVVTLPITYRLPKGSVGSWGNQFYVFDVIDWLAARQEDLRAIVLDSDCLWLRPAAELESAIDAQGALTYTLGPDEHPEGEPINGLTREGMARFLRGQGGVSGDRAEYFGGEILAAGSAALRRIAARARDIWPRVQAQEPDAPREEAHFLSIIYALEGFTAGTANRFIRRMWTTFHHHNLHPGDRDLTIWHLPAEKRAGFADLFARIAAHPQLHPVRDAAAMGLDPAFYARDMGWPRRRPAKLVRDLTLKIMEKLRF